MFQIQWFVVYTLKRVEVFLFVLFGDYDHAALNVHYPLLQPSSVYIISSV
jgi:hypothetical protein